MHGQGVQNSHAKVLRPEGSEHTQGPEIQGPVVAPRALSARSQEGRNEVRLEPDPTGP